MDLAERGARFLLGLMLLLAAAAFWVLLPFLGPIALGLVAAWLTRRWYAAALARVRRPGVAAGLVVFATLVVIVAPIALFLAFMADDLVRLASGLAGGGAERNVRDALVSLGVPGRSVAAGVDAVMANAQGLARRLAEDLVSQAFPAVIGVFVLFFVQFFGLAQGPQLVAFVRRAVPLPTARMDRLLAETGRAVDAIFRGHVLVSLIQGALATLGWWIFRYPDPLLWGFVATILSLIPFTGAPLLMVPVGLWSALQGQWGRGLGFVAFAVVVVGLVDNFLRPWIIARTGEIHPVFVLVGILGGLAAFGLAGLFLGPLVLVLLRSVILVWTMDGEAKQEFAA